MELALTGENLPAERAHALGMVNVLAEPGGALDAAIALAERITANGPLAVAATKRIIVESRGWSPDTRFAEQDKILAPVFIVERRQGGRDRVRREAPPTLDRYLSRSDSDRRADAESHSASPARAILCLLALPCALALAA